MRDKSFGRAIKLGLALWLLGCLGWAGYAVRQGGPQLGSLEEALGLAVRLWTIGVVWLGGTLGLALFYWGFGRGDRNEGPESTRRKDLGP